MLSDAGRALLVVGIRCGGEHLLYVERQRGGWHVDAVLEQQLAHCDGQVFIVQYHARVGLKGVRSEMRRCISGSRCSLLNLIISADLSVLSVMVSLLPWVMVLSPADAVVAEARHVHGSVRLQIRRNDGLGGAHLERRPACRRNTKYEREPP